MATLLFFEYYASPPRLKTMKLHILTTTVLTYSLFLLSCDNGKTHQAQIDEITSREQAIIQLKDELKLSRSQFNSMKGTFENKRLQTLADFKKQEAAIEAEKSNQKHIKQLLATKTQKLEERQTMLSKTLDNAMERQNSAEQTLKKAQELQKKADYKLKTAEKLVATSQHRQKELEALSKKERELAHSNKLLKNQLITLNQKQHSLNADYKNSLQHLTDLNTRHELLKRKHGQLIKDFDMVSCNLRDTKAQFVKYQNEIHQKRSTHSSKISDLEKRTTKLSDELSAYKVLTKEQSIELLAKKKSLQELQKKVDQMNNNKQKK